MTYCVSCGAENADGTQFCVRCGASIAPTPAPESWKASGDIGNQAPPTGDPSGGFNPGGTPGGYNPSQGAYQAYNPPQTPMVYPQQQGVAQPMHPAVPAIVSLLIPGAGLFFVKDKAGLAIGILVGWIVFWIVTFILSFVFIGFCLMLLAPLIHIGAALLSWDEAAKQSGGQFAPILFK